MVLGGGDYGCRRSERMVVGGGRGWLWEEGENGWMEKGKNGGRRKRMVVGGGREWLWEEGENSYGRRERIVMGGGRE
jgi:hypothetical protein